MGVEQRGITLKGTRKNVTEVQGKGQKRILVYSDGEEDVVGSVTGRTAGVLLIRDGNRINSKIISYRNTFMATIFFYHW